MRVMIEVIGNEISVQMKANSGIAQPELAAQAARSKQEQEERAKKKGSQGSVVGRLTLQMNQARLTRREL
jgi:hypothetical protein